MNEMPACSACVCRLIGEDVKTAASIFLARMTKGGVLVETKTIRLWVTDPSPALPSRSPLTVRIGFLFHQRPNDNQVQVGKQISMAVSCDLYDADYSCFVRLFVLKS